MSLIASAIVADCGAVSLALARGTRAEARVTMSPGIIFSQNPMTMNETMKAEADAAIRWYQRASSVAEGGWGLLSFGQADLDMRIAAMLSAKLQFEDAEHRLRRAIRRDGMEDLLCKSLMWILHAEFRDDEMLALAEQSLIEHQGFPVTQETYLSMTSNYGKTDRAVDFCRRRADKFPDDDASANGLAVALINAGRQDESLAMWRQRVERRPGDLYTMRMLSLALLDSQKPDEAEHWIKRTLLMDPNNASAYYYLAVALGLQQRMDEAVDTLRKGLTIEPDSLTLNASMAGALSALGRDGEAQAFQQKATAIQEQMQQHP